MPALPFIGLPLGLPHHAKYTEVQEYIYGVNRSAEVKQFYFTVASLPMSAPATQGLIQRCGAQQLRWQRRAPLGGARNGLTVKFVKFVNFVKAIAASFRSFWPIDSNPSPQLIVKAIAASFRSFRSFWPIDSNPSPQLIILHNIVIVRHNTRWTVHGQAQGQLESVSNTVLRTIGIDGCSLVRACSGHVSLQLETLKVHRSLAKRQHRTRETTAASQGVWIA